jgi:hypothetical protein
MHGLLPPIFSSVSHHKVNSSYNHFAGQDKLVIDPAETVSAGSLTNLKFEYFDFLGEYEAMCETALGSESGP